MKTKELTVVLNDEAPLTDTERALREKAVGTQEQHVRREFTPEQMQEFKEELTAKTITLHGCEKKKKALVSTLDAEIKGLKEEVKQNAEKIKSGYEETLETVYLIDDQDAKVMEFVDRTGAVVGSRPLMKSERQLNIVSEASKVS